MLSNRRKAKKVQELFQFYRGMILESCEQEFGDNQKWSYLRGRLLKLLSQDRGLECKVLATILEGDDEDISSN